jgi:hypothetical protein
MKQEKFVIKNDTKVQKDDYVLICKNIENTIYYPDRHSIILIKDLSQYYPIFFLKKGTKDSVIQIKKVYEPSSNIIKNIIDYTNQNCKDLINKDLSLTAKQIYYSHSKDIQSQIIDAKFKCKYLLSKNNILIPCTISGSISNLDILYDSDITKYITDINKTIDEIYSILKIYPAGVYFNNKNEGSKYTVDGLMYSREISIPIKITEMTKDGIQKLSKKLGIKEFGIEKRNQYDQIDKLITEGLNINDKKGILDVNIDTYKIDGYKQFKLELSNFILLDDELINKLTDLYYSKKSYDDKSYSIKKLFYKIVNKDLVKYLNILKNIKDEEDEEDEKDTKKGGNVNGQQGGDLVHTIKKLPELNDYNTKNKVHLP